MKNGTTWLELDFWNSAKYEEIQKRLEDLGPGNYLPHRDLWFRALEYTPFDKVKVVIIGQDPYHTPNSAHGLAFSTNPTHRIPPSLRNIFTEYCSDLGFPYPRNGYLKPWADEGVLLLNSCLTCELGKPRAHRGWGWEQLAAEIVYKLAEQEKHIVFILWGRDALEYCELTGHFKKNLVIHSPHPSPYSAASGFFGSKPFSRANEYLVRNGVDPVNWRLS